jgi:tripartite-type tricarboxylate transporter receptor subunit TctC
MQRYIVAAIVSVLALFAAPQAAAQWPNKPIKWIVPYTPGGITDSATRMIVQKLEATLGQPVVIENKPGANSMVGAEMVARAPADGYTVLTVIAAHAANGTLYAGRIPFDPVKSFTPISLVAVAPLLMTVNPNFPAKDFRELIAYAKANPGKISYGTSGVGSASHLTTELLKQTANIDMVHVPYKGTAPALTAVLAGDIQVLVDVPSSLMPHVRAGKIRALGLFSGKRIAGAAEVPTIVEAGGPAIEGSTWVLFLAPAGTPREIVTRLSSEIGKIVATPEMNGRFEQIGIEPVVSTPEQSAKFLDDEIAKWAKVITTANVKPEQ